MKCYAEQIRAQREAETKKVKAALRAAGYKKVRVGHGRGTTWGWLQVTVDYTGSYMDALRHVEEIVVKASGRTGLAAENITVNLNRADNAPFPEKSPEGKLLKAVFGDKAKTMVTAAPTYDLMRWPSLSKYTN